jgi:hypothetical protein
MSYPSSPLDISRGMSSGKLEQLITTNKSARAAPGHCMVTASPPNKSPSLSSIGDFLVAKVGDEKLDHFGSASLVGLVCCTTITPQGYWVPKWNCQH